MPSWIRDFFASSRMTKLLLLNLFLFGAGTILTGIYCYARLDYVRSYQIQSINEK